MRGDTGKDQMSELIQRCCAPKVAGSEHVPLQMSHRSCSTAAEPVVNLDGQHDWARLVVLASYPFLAELAADYRHCRIGHNYSGNKNLTWDLRWWD